MTARLRSAALVALEVTTSDMAITVKIGRDLRVVLPEQDAVELAEQVIDGLTQIRARRRREEETA